MRRLYFSLGKNEFWEYVLLALFLLFFYGPLMNMLLLSFAGDYEYPDVIPRSYGFKWWDYVLSKAQLVQSIGTSLVLAVVVTLLSLAVCLPAAYALARYPFRDAEVFTTYAIVDEACTLNAADAVLGAVLRRQTIVTKGPLFTAHSEKGRVTVIFDNTSGYLDWAPAQAAAPVLELRDSTGAVQRAETDLRTPLSLSLAPGARSAVLKLYAGACAPVHLLAVGAPLYLDKEGNG